MKKFVPVLFLGFLFSCSTTPFYNYQGNDTSAVQSELRATKISSSKDHFQVYRLNGDRIAIVSPKQASPTGELSEVSVAAILNKDQIVTLVSVLQAIVNAYDTKDKVENQLEDFVLVENAVKTNIQTNAFGLPNSVVSSTNISSGREILFRIQYSFTKGVFAVEKTTCYSRGQGGPNMAESVSNDDIKGLLENLKK